VLSTRHHLRSALDFGERFGATIRAPRAGMHELPEDRVEPYEWGEEVTGGIRARHVLDEWPDETALEVPGHNAVVIADCIVNYGQLGFVPDQYFGDDPEDEKAKIRAAFARVVEEVEFDNLLFAHGDPVVGGARDALRVFVGAQ
jgi:glyoxylase-like metal-dependent hydrolase (beta-lactamase superfamily II)